MANNRLFLIHKPSRVGVYLGKRMGFGWYDAQKKERIDNFFEYVKANSIYETQDDFMLALEDCNNSSCFDDWQYSKDQPLENIGLTKFDFKNEKNN